MYKWVRTPSPSFPKANLNEVPPDDQNTSSILLLNTPIMNNTWDKRDILDTYIHHTIITSPVRINISPGTTPRSSRPISKSLRTDKCSFRRASWHDTNLDCSRYLELQAGKCFRNRDEFQSTIANLKHLESTRDKSLPEKVKFLCI